MEGEEPEKSIYGQAGQLIVESIRENSHREPSWYDENNRPMDWVTVTSYSVRFNNGGWFTRQVQDEIVNIHRGDKFEAYLYAGHFTYLRNINTDEVIYNNPVENPEWTEYNKKKQIEARNLRYQKNFLGNINQKWYYIIPAFIIFGILGVIDHNPMLLVPALIICLVLLYKN